MANKGSKNSSEEPLSACNTPTEQADQIMQFNLERVLENSLLVKVLDHEKFLHHAKCASYFKYIHKIKKEETEETGLMSMKSTYCVAEITETPFLMIKPSEINFFFHQTLKMS